MNRAQELHQAGQLGAAIQELISEVKANPNNISGRTFLFELLCFAGEWNRAEKQLDVIGHQNATAEAGVQVYRHNITAERDRRRLFTEGLQPHFLAEPPAYVDLHLEAINHLRAGHFAQARETLDRAEEERPALAGMLNDRLFQDFRDYDDLLGPVLEIIVGDKYTWLPFDQISVIEIPAPTQLRDLIWATATIETAGRQLKAFLPTLYVNSNEFPDDRVKLGRMTDWKQVGDELYLGAGLHLFAVDGEEVPILEVRSIAFDPRGAGDEPPAS